MHCLYLYDSNVQYGMPITSLTVELINDNKLVRDLLFYLRMRLLFHSGNLRAVVAWTSQTLGLPSCARIKTAVVSR